MRPLEERLFEKVDRDQIGTGCWIWTAGKRHIVYWPVIAYVALVLVGTLFFLWLSSPARAQQPACGPHEEIVKHLTEKYGERAMFYGSTGEPGKPITVQFWANKETRTWTVLLAREDGVSCVASSGDGLKPAPAPKPVEQKS